MNIPKPGGKTRPLGIPTLNDRLVQEVLRTVLEPIFEPTFSRNSHGFRPGRSCHTALKYVNTEFRTASWVIEGDIKSYFDSINHNILMHLIKRKVKDGMVLNLIEKGLKCGIIIGDQKIEPVSGTPQGGILSPLLSNIYLDKLDKFMEKLEETYKGKRQTPRANPEYAKLMKNDRKTYNPKLARKLRLSSKDPFDREYKLLKYVRYADDFLIGVTGSYKDACEIKEKVRIFLKEELDIELSLEKTLITHASRRILFLGYLIGRLSVLYKQRFGKYGKKATGRRTISTLDGSMSKMIAHLANKGFCDGNGKPKPNMKMLAFPQTEINVRINAVIRGISE